MDKSAYVTDLSRIIETNLLSNIADGEIRRRRLRRGLALAYVEGDSGILSLSRVFPAWPSDDEIRIVKRDFKEAAQRAGRPVLLIKEIERVVLDSISNTHCVVRLAVYFGKQGRLL